MKQPSRKRRPLTCAPSAAPGRLVPRRRLGAVIIAGRTEPLGGNVLQLSVTGAIGLLALVVLILLAAEWMDRLAERRRTPRRPADPKAL